MNHRKREEESERDIYARLETQQNKGDKSDAKI
jgi:hypothetical protein